MSMALRTQRIMRETQFLQMPSYRHSTSSRSTATTTVYPCTMMLLHTTMLLRSIMLWLRRTILSPRTTRA